MTCLSGAIRPIVDGQKVRWRRLVASASFATVMIVGMSAAGIGGVSPAQAQAPSSVGNLFEPDYSNLLGDAAARLQPVVNHARTSQAAGNCPNIANFKIETSASLDTDYVKALFEGRRETLSKELRRLGLQDSQFVIERGGTGNSAQMSYGPRDLEKPTLHTSSTPRIGTKVKAGDRITVTMVARDNVNSWQTGIQTIQLKAESEGNLLVPNAQSYPARPRDCNRPPEERRHVVVYTVPANPPPVVRLRAIAEDFANQHDTDIAEFPTGELAGRFEWRHIIHGAGGGETVAVADFSLDSDGQGNLTGRMTGQIPQRTWNVPGCPTRFVGPGSFQAKLVGSYTPGSNTFSAQVTESQNTGPRAVDCGGTTRNMPFYEVHQTPIFRDAFRDLRAAADGSWRSSGERSGSMGGGSYTTRYSLTLRRTQN